MENEVKEPLSPEQKDAAVVTEAVSEIKEESAEAKKVGICSCSFSPKRTLIILLAMFIGFAIGIGVTWIAFDRLNQPTVDETVEIEDEKADAPKAKKGSKGGKGGRARMQISPEKITDMALGNAGRAMMVYNKKFKSYPSFANDLFPAVDGWGNFLVFKANDKGFTLSSCGPDGKPGTKDDIVWTPRKRGAGKGKGKGAPKKK